VPGNAELPFLSWRRIELLRNIQANYGYYRNVKPGLLKHKPLRLQEASVSYFVLVDGFSVEFQRVVYLCSFVLLFKIGKVLRNFWSSQYGARSVILNLWSSKRRSVCVISLLTFPLHCPIPADTLHKSLLSCVCLMVDILMRMCPFFTMFPVEGSASPMVLSYAHWDRPVQSLGWEAARRT
jgi:hypothetical protein